MANLRAAISGADRKLSELVDPKDPDNSSWRIRFRLTPINIDPYWALHFENQAARRHAQQPLRYRPMLKIRQGSRWTRYTGEPVALVHMILRLLFRRPVFVEVICPAGQQHVRAAQAEAAALVLSTNAAVAHSLGHSERQAAARDKAIKALAEAVECAQQGVIAGDAAPTPQDAVVPTLERKPVAAISR